MLKNFPFDLLDYFIWRSLTFDVWCLMEQNDLQVCEVNIFIEYLSFLKHISTHNTLTLGFLFT